ncbi:metallophosphoesterase family protein [Rubritalea tangerina]|uniref:Metallophosphoesterase family protein n=2 Tax=Rubritalea tangerina TaxID=430798 RepID=A0ABW4Z6P4_9BACT
MPLVIGDIHGCHRQLNDLLALLSPSSNTPIITLGDYIDRGPDTKGVIDTLIALGPQLIHLKGNHDVFMEQARTDSAMYDFWLQPMVGGQETLDAYGGHLDNVPDAHWQFLASAKLYHELDDFICVHGGLDPKVPLAQQSPEVLLNLRFQHAKKHCSGKTIICGHTRQIDGKPKLRRNTLCIDTNVFGGGYLTAFDTQQHIIYQVDENSQCQQFPFSIS